MRHKMAGRLSTATTQTREWSLLEGGTMRATRLLLVFVVSLATCNGKGVQAPSATDEYLASFFQPSSYETSPDPAEMLNRDERETTLVCACDTTAEPAPLPLPNEENVLDTNRFAAAMENVQRLDDTFSKVVTLETRLSDLERSSNKLKKLAMAAMSVALAGEGEACAEVEALGLQNLIKGFPAFTPQTSTQATAAGLSCDDLGSATRPASSCKHLKLACNKPSGAYYIDNGYFTQVFCEMGLFGGGWTRYGKAGMQNEWNFVDEDMIEVNLEIMDPRDIKEMIDMKYNTFRIHTDVTFSLQADDSTNPSRVHARVLPWGHQASFYIDGYGENFTRLEFLSGGNRITCRNTPGTSHKCGWGSVPRPNEGSDQVLIESVYFGPRARARGAMTYREEWRANRYTWSGSYYYVYAK